MSGTAVISESIRDSFDGECLSFGHEEETLVVRLHRQPCNEIGTAMLSELEVVAEYLRRGAGGARALLWTSELESGFSAGADLRELFHSLIDRRAREVSVATQQNEVAAFLSRIHRAFEVFDRAPILTVAAVHGVVFGGGLELMLTSDVVVADKSARFGFPSCASASYPALEAYHDSTATSGTRSSATCSSPAAVFAPRVRMRLDWCLRSSRGVKRRRWRSASPSKPLGSTAPRCH